MTPSASLADDLRRQLRHASTAQPEWVVPVNEALAEAYRRGSSQDIAEVALLGAVWLDASGRSDEAIANVDFALAMIGTPSEQRSHLLCARAAILAIGGRLGAARASLWQAREALGRGARSRLELQTYEALLACVALDDVPIHAITDPIGAAERARMDWLASGLTIWLVPWLAARGATSEALTWTRALAARAAAADHAVRAADARSMDVALDVAAGADATWIDVEQASAHPPGWRRAALAFARASMLRGRWDGARRALAEHEGRVARMNPGFRASSDGFGACLEAYAGEAGVPLPSGDAAPITVASLPALLASSEAAALAGSIQMCLVWLRVLARIPATVTTSLEWPASIDRIRGLLLVRLGRIAQARTSFARAIRAMEAAGNPIEVELTRLHRAEAEAIAARRPDRGLVRERGEAMRRLVALGVNPFPAAYAVTRALSDDRVGAASDLLTARELEVVRALADGLSYRGAAERLGISWRTVQSHATNVYRKLGTSRRAEAVAAARARRLIER